MRTIFNNFLNFLAKDYLGEMAALLAACLWAVASIIYGRLGQRIPPRELNLVKGAIAIALLLLTILITGEIVSQLAPVPLCLLLLSGAIGIGLGDTTFFITINTLGARQALLLGLLAPPITAIIALIFLREQLNVAAWSGILLTVIGVAWVISERTPGSDGRNSDRLILGVSFGLLTALTNATGSVLSRAALANTTISPLWAALLRLIAGVSVLILWAIFTSRRHNREITDKFRFQSLLSWQIGGTAFFAATCGTYLGIWLQQTAIKFSEVGIASTLLQTSPLFVIPLAAWTGEKITPTSIAGVLVAIAGVGLLFYLK